MGKEGDGEKEEQEEEDGDGPTRVTPEMMAEVERLGKSGGAGGNLPHTHRLTRQGRSCVMSSRNDAQGTRQAQVPGEAPR